MGYLWDNEGALASNAILVWASPEGKVIRQSAVPGLLVAFLSRDAAGVNCVKSARRSWSCLMRQAPQYATDETTQTGIDSYAQPPAQ